MTTGTATAAVTEISVFANVGSSPALVKVSNGAAGQAVFLGPTGVLASTGAKLESVTTQEFVVHAGDELFCIVAGTTQVVTFVSSQA